jgi:hypothetical protein
LRDTLEKSLEFRSSAAEPSRRRADRNSQHRGNLFVVEALDVPQKEYGSQRRFDALEGLLQQIGIFQPLSGLDLT